MMKKIYLLLLLCCVYIAAKAQTTFNFTGSVQTYTVPGGVTAISVDLAGGQGGNYPSPAAAGGLGGRAQGTIAVTPGQVLQVYVGSAGTNGSCGTGGSNSGGGAQGGQGGCSSGGAGGGGSSDIRTTAGVLSSRLIVAGGGGGAAWNSGGEFGGGGGGLTGGLGSAVGTSGWTAGGCGGPGTQTAGGAAATSGAGATAGGLGFGGNGTFYGGGGGGGYYGAGGGYAGGASGGSSFIAGTGVSAATTTPAFRSGNGYVVITPALPTVTASPTSLAFGSVTPTFTSGLLSFSYTGSFLTASSSLTITAPANFEVSADGSTWSGLGGSISVAYTGTSIPTAVAILARFVPPAVASYSGNITITGGGLASATNIAVTGNGSAACSASPSAGTAGASPASGNSATAITLTLSGASSGGGLTFQWQSSPDASSWTNIAGANTNPFVFTGLTGNTHFRCVTTCPTFGSANSSSTFVTFTFPGVGCTPSYATACSGLPMPCSIASLVGVSPTSITDPSTTCGGTGPNYQDRTGTMSVSLLQGTNYTANIGGNGYAGGTNYACQVWIDFNDNGTFTSDEVIGGGYVTSAATSGANAMTFAIPASANLGTHRMRIVGNYSGCCGGVAYPSISPCITSSVTYGETRDYRVTIVAAPPAATSAPTSLAFGPVTASTATINPGSVPPRFITVNAVALVPSSGLLTLTPPAGFELSSDGVSWTGSPLNVLYSSSALSNRRIFVRFKPSATGAATGNIAITGGGLAAAVNVAVTGTGTTACTGTPTAGTAAISPASGNSLTNFTLTLSGSSASGGLAYQWQRSVDGGTTWVNHARWLVSQLILFTGIALATTQFRCVS
jgi:hypothetical protein